MKKIIALLTAALLLISMLPMSVMAADDTALITVGSGTMSTAEKEVVIPVTMAANYPNVDAMTFEVAYDEAVMTLTAIQTGTDVVVPGYGTMNIAFVKGADGTAVTVMSNAVAGKVSFAHQTGIVPAENGTLFNLVFQMKDNAETGSYPIEVTATTFNYSGSPVAHTITDGAINIVGSDPIVTTVSLAETEVTVNGGNTAAKTVQASAASAMGTDITDKVAWSVSPADGGVTVDTNGLITADAKADAGTYTITAAPIAGKTAGTKQSVTLNVAHIGSSLTAVTVDGAASVEVNGEDKTETYTVKGYDQYDKEMTISGTVNWTLSGDSVGASIANGVLTVPGTAETGTVTVTATSESISGAMEVAITRETAVPVSIDLTGAVNKIIPADGAADTSFDLTASMTDQFGDAYTAPLTWSIEPQIDGVTVNHGKVTVSNAAKNGIAASQTFTVTAKYSDALQASAAFTVSRDTTVVATSLVISKDGTPLTGTVDNVIVPPSGSKPYTYTAKVFDQYGAEMAVDPAFDWSEHFGSFSDGVLTVASTVTNGVTGTLIVSYDRLSVSVSVTAAALELVAPNVTVEDDAVYGDTWNEIITISGGKAFLNGSAVTGAFYVKNGNNVPKSGSQTYEVWFKSSDNAYDLRAVSGEAFIAKAPLTLTWSNETFTYNGKVQQPTAVINGRIGNDDVTVQVSGGAAAAGTAKAVAAISGADVSNYELPTNLEKIYTISTAALTVTANDKTITYGEAPVGNGVSFTGFVNGETEAVVSGTVTYDFNYNQFGDVGTYAITPAGLNADNYMISYKKGSLEVVPLDVTVLWTNTTLQYNGTAQAPAAEVVGTVNGDVVGVTVSGAQTNVGNYTATAQKLTGTKARNYTMTAGTTTSFSIEKGTYTGDLSTSVNALINKEQELTVAMTTALQKFGGTITDVTVLEDNSNIVKNVSFEGTKVTIFVNDVAQIGLTARVQVSIDSDNYKTCTAVITVVTVAKENANVQLINVPDGKLTYGDRDFYLGARAYVREEGEWNWACDNNKVLVVENGNVTIVGAGTATVTVTFESENYIGSASTVIRVEKADLIVRPQSMKIKTNAALPEPRVEYVGLKNGDKSSILDLIDGSLEMQFYKSDYEVLTKTDKKGTYEIRFVDTPEFAALQNYNVIVTNGTLTIGSNSNLLPLFGQSSGESRFEGFKDIPEDAYYAYAVDWAIDNAVTEGTGRYTFSPDEVCTRAQMVTFLWRAVGCPMANDGYNAFNDVSRTSYYYDAVMWAVEAGITNGTSDNIFSPNDPVSRGQVVTFLYRLNGKMETVKESRFDDVAADAYYCDAVEWAAKAGITYGTGEDTFSPEASCTRAQIVAFLYRYMVG